MNRYEISYSVVNGNVNDWTGIYIIECYGSSLSARMMFRHAIKNRDYADRVIITNVRLLEENI